MWDNVIIGEGNKLASAVHVFNVEGDHSISENSVSYWITENSVIKRGVGMTIFKDTDEGEQLTKLIKDRTPLSEIETYLVKLWMGRIDPLVLATKIKNENNHHYARGRNSMRYEIKSLLNSHD